MDILAEIQTLRRENQYDRQESVVLLELLSWKTACQVDSPDIFRDRISVYRHDPMIGIVINGVLPFLSSTSSEMIRREARLQDLLQQQYGAILVGERFIAITPGEMKRQKQQQQLRYRRQHGVLPLDVNEGISPADIDRKNARRIMEELTQTDTFLPQKYTDCILDLNVMADDYEPPPCIELVDELLLLGIYRRIFLNLVFILIHTPEFGAPPDMVKKAIAGLRIVIQKVPPEHHEQFFITDGLHYEFVNLINVDHLNRSTLFIMIHDLVRGTN